MLPEIATLAHIFNNTYCHHSDPSASEFIYDSFNWSKLQMSINKIEHKKSYFHFPKIILIDLFNGKENIEEKPYY
jgi:hypothetical protein